SVEAAAHQFLSQYMGSTDVQITRQNDPRGGVSESIIEQVRAHPAVESVDGRLEIGNLLLNEATGVPEGRSAQIIGLDRPSDRRVESMRIVAGEWFSTNDAEVAVIDQSVAES